MDPHKLNLIQSLVAMVFGVTMVLTCAFNPPIDIAILILSSIITIVGLVFFFIEVFRK